jgi:dipeptidyl aminopeptidase/acylaminoacyl peptidase
MERSPITYVDQIRTPLFVIQGANDPRVVKGESDQIVERLRERGVPVRYDVYDDEGHGFTRRENELKATRDTATFLEQHLVAQPEVAGRRT